MSLKNSLKTHFEDIIVTSTFFVGLIGGVFLVNLGSREMYTSAAIFFALALTAFTHRFLGGINEDTSFSVGTLKVTGTFAVLLGSFWLINQSFSTGATPGEPIGNYRLPADFRPGTVFLFDNAGNPLEMVFREIEHGDTVEVRFPRLPAEKYKRVSRTLSQEEGQLYIKTGDETTYLGMVDASPKAVNEDLLTLEQHLSLGMYYSQILDRTADPQVRRDPKLAIRHLGRVLESPEADNPSRLEALNQMYYLRQYIKAGEDFERILTSLQDLKTGYHMYLEMGATYLQYAINMTEKREKHRKLALINYLQCLASYSDVKNERNRGVITVVTNLINIYLSDDPYVRSNGKDILQSIDREDLRALNSHIRALQQTVEG